MGKRKIILKYNLDDERTQQSVEVRGGDPKVLSIQVQNEQVVMWVECTENDIFSCKITVNMQVTGQDYWGSPGQYFATTQTQDGSYVAHWFIGGIHPTC